LVRLSEPIPKNKKLCDFLNGITDPQCANIKLNVLSNTTYMNDFHAMVNYVVSAIDMTTKNTSLSAQQISELNPSNGQNGGRGHGRGGCGKGRGRGRGRGRGNRNRNNDNSTVVSGNKSYTADEWPNLSYAQKQEVYRQRERLAMARTGSVILTENQSQQGQSDEVSAITTPTVNVQAAANNNQASNNNANRVNAQISLDNVSQPMSRQRTSGAYKILSRQLKSMNMQMEDEIKSGRAELDTHADTCGVNNVARILEFTGQVAGVSGFANSMQALQDIPIVKAALAYDDPNTGETIVLIINQALYFGKHMDDILLNPNKI
jgi:hypothetical protein